MYSSSCWLEMLAVRLKEMAVTLEGHEPMLTLSLSMQLPVARLLEVSGLRLNHLNAVCEVLLNCSGVARSEKEVKEEEKSDVKSKEDVESDGAWPLRALSWLCGGENLESLQWESFSEYPPPQTEPQLPPSRAMPQAPTWEPLR